MKKPLAGLNSLLDYYLPVSDGIQMLKNDGFLAAWKLRGPDMEGMSFDDANAICHRIAESLRLGEGWAIQSDQCQSKATEYQTISDHQWPNPVSRLIDLERKRYFSDPEVGQCFNSDFYFSLTYRPQSKVGDKGIDWVFGSDDESSEGRAQRELKRFQRVVDDVESALRSNLSPNDDGMTFVSRLGYVKSRGQRQDELCRYLRRCISGEDYPFAMPSDLMPLDQLLSEPFVAGKFPELGEEGESRHICTIAINAFPETPGTGSYPAMMSALSALPFAFRFTQQGRCISESAAQKLHDTNAGRWSTIKTGLQFFRSSKQQNGDNHASRLEEEAKAASNDAAHGLRYYVHYTAKLVLIGKDVNVLRDQYRTVTNMLKRIGFSCQLETTNATQSWLSSLPGHAHRERRLFLATVTNLAHLAQFSSPYIGLQHNPSRAFPAKTPPLFYAATMGSTPFRFHAQVPGTESSGHVLVAGPSGSGKTTLLASMVCQFPRVHPDAQIFAFDKESTLYTLVHAMGGDFYDFSDLRFCPLQHVDDPAEAAWAQIYLELLCELNGLQLNAEHRSAIGFALTLLADSDRRSLTHFQSLIRPESPEVAEVLQYYTIGSVGGGLLDGNRDNLSIGRVSAFELGKLYKGSPRMTSAVLFYLFHRIQQRFDPQKPMLITIDELRSSLEHEVAVRNLEAFLIEGRKQNVSTAMAIQDLDKVIESPLANTISRECQTKIFLANRNAKDAEKPAYSVFGATDQDLEVITNLEPCRQYYVSSPAGKASIDLRLSDIALSFLAKSGQHHREQVATLMRSHPNDWQARWLERQIPPRSNPAYFTDAAQVLRSFAPKEEYAQAIA